MEAIENGFTIKRLRELLARGVPQDIAIKRARKKRRRLVQMLRCLGYSKKQRWWAKWQERIRTANETPN